jgi:hypothetical protein
MVKSNFYFRLLEMNNDTKTQHCIGIVYFKTKPKRLAGSDIQYLTEKMPSRASMFQSAECIRNCTINGIFIESFKDKKTDNSIVLMKEKFLGKIMYILIIKNQVFLALQVDYKITDKNFQSQYYKMEKLENELFYIRNIEKLEAKVVFCKEKSYFVVPPNLVECD